VFPSWNGPLARTVAPGRPVDRSLALDRHGLAAERPHVGRGGLSCRRFPARSPPLPNRPRAAAGGIRGLSLRRSARHEGVAFRMTLTGDVLCARGLAWVLRLLGVGRSCPGFSAVGCAVVIGFLRLSRLSETAANPLARVCSCAPPFRHAGFTLPMTADCHVVLRLTPVRRVYEPRCPASLRLR